MVFEIGVVEGALEGDPSVISVDTFIVLFEELAVTSVDTSIVLFVNLSVYITVVPESVLTEVGCPVLELDDPVLLDCAVLELLGRSVLPELD